MMTRLRAAAVVAGCLFASAVAAKSDPKPLEVEKSLKPPAGESYFDDVFALNTNAKQLGALRTDGATFAKLDFIDVATAKVTKSFDLPSKTLAAQIGAICCDRTRVSIAFHRPVLPKSGCCLWTQVRLERSSGSSRSSSVPSTAGR